MAYTLTILKVDGTREVVTQKQKPGLEQLQQAVGGYIEAVPELNKFEGKRAEAWVNEEGKLIGQQVNGPATTVYRQFLRDKFPKAAHTGGINWDMTVLNGPVAFVTKEA